MSWKREGGIDCCSKFATGQKGLNRHRSKNIWVARLFFCQNGSLMRYLITLTKGQLGHPYTFWTIPILIFSPVANFEQQSLYSMYLSLSSFITGMAQVEPVPKMDLNVGLARKGMRNFPKPTKKSIKRVSQWKQHWKQSYLLQLKLLHHPVK